MQRLIYPLLVVFAASCYGILSTIIKLAIGAGFTASEAVTSQYYSGFFIALVLVILFKRSVPTFGGGWTLFFAGLFTATTGTVYGQAVQHMPASLAVVLLFQFTWIGMLFDCIAKKRLPSKPETLSLILLFGGTILAAGIIDVDLSAIPLQGWLWGFASAISFASFIVINQRQIKGMDTLTRLFYTSLIGALFITLFQTPQIVWDGTLFAGGLWKFGLVLGLFGTVTPIYLLSIAVPKVGTGVSSILSAMELPVAVAASTLVLGEQLTALQLLGIGIILFGMTLSTAVDLYRDKKKHRTQRPNSL